MSNKKLSPHFTIDECKCWCSRHKREPYVPVTAKLLGLAENIRDILGRPMIVHSVCRCKEHNAEVGGSPTSKHITGKAMDFHCNGMKPVQILSAIVSAYNDGMLPSLGGIGLYDWGIHIDTEKSADGHLRRWDLRKKR